MEKKDIEIPFGAFDSELGGFEYTIPEGYEAEIKDGKVVVRKKESEDERLRKALMQNLKERFGTKGNMGEGLDMPDVLAWLEKQGEQKPVDEVKPKFKVGDVLRKKGKDYTFTVDRIQGGYYHCDHNNGAFFPIEEQDKWELVEQKPAWSKEDEKMLKDTIRFCELCGNQVSADWLKSLRPQNTWRPSEEQMKALRYLDKGIPLNDFDKRVLHVLIDQLKKLKDEQL